MWRRSTLAGALVLTLVDAVLLQQTKSFFTGGFLSRAFVTGPLETTAFVLVSIIADAALVGVMAGMAVWVLARVRLTQPARTFGVLAAALSVPLLMDFASYRLFSYLGDAFDLGMMFELAGRRASELAAVASPQVVQIAGLAGTGLGCVAALVAIVDRFGRSGRRTLPPSSRAIAIPAATLFFAGMLVTSVLGAANETLGDGLSRKPSGRIFESIVAAFTDVDRDGFGLAGGMRDQSPFEAAQHPWAVDVPGNGIDEDGIGGDLPGGTPAYEEGGTSARTWKQRPDVLLFVLESFRADAVGRRVNGHPVTPVLDRLSEEGVASSRAYSHNGYTAQSRFHLLVGSLAGLRAGTSLIDDFRSNGYQTAYFSAQDESFGGPAWDAGFARAEVAYDARTDRNRRSSTFSTPGSLAVSHVTLTERIAAFLASRDRGRPLLLYVNFHDTHYPYHHAQIEPLVSPTVLPAGRIAPSRQAALEEMYFNSAANVDRAVGDVIMRATAALGHAPAVIVTADHGESLFDENFLGHGYALNDVQTRVPLIVRGLPLEIAEPFGQADLRDAVDAALSSDASRRAFGPRVVQRPDRLVFQYLGQLRRPRQIGFVNGSTRTLYDFRQRAALVGNGGWRRPEMLSGDQQAAYLDLVRFWERMMLAKAEP